MGKESSAKPLTSLYFISWIPIGCHDISVIQLDWSPSFTILSINPTKYWKKLFSKQRNLCLYSSSWFLGTPPKWVKRPRNTTTCICSHYLLPGLAWDVLISCALLPALFVPVGASTKGPFSDRSSRKERELEYNPFSAHGTSQSLFKLWILCTSTWNFPGSQDIFRAATCISVCLNF